jgi:hypothetical protein
MKMQGELEEELEEREGERERTVHWQIENCHQ